MIKNTSILLTIVILLITFETTAAEQQLTATQSVAKEQADQKAQNELDQFGFGPALFLYNMTRKYLKIQKMSLLEEMGRFF